MAFYKEFMAFEPLWLMFERPNMGQATAELRANPKVDRTAYDGA